MRSSRAASSDWYWPKTPWSRRERNFGTAGVGPRLGLGHGRPCAPPVIDVLAGRDDYLGTVLDELEREPFPESLVIAKRRSVLDRRGHSPLAVLADAVAG